MAEFIENGGAAINVEVPDGFEARWVDGVLKLVDLDKEKRLKERAFIEARKDRVKTFMDACDKLGNNDGLVQGFSKIRKALECSSSVKAYLKLQIICRALKVGQPDTDANNAVYLPSISFLTSEDRDGFAYKDWCSLKEIPEDCKRQYSVLRDCLKVSVSVSTFYDVKMCGPGYWYRGGIPFGLFLQNKDLAWYFGDQFMDIWIGYLCGD